MKKEVPAPVLITVTVVVVLVIGFFIYRGLQGEVGTGTQADRELNQVLTRTRGDVSKMTPEERRIYDESIRKGIYNPEGGSSPMSSTGGSPPASSPQ